MSGDVYYSDSTDWIAPKVGEVVLRRIARRHVRRRVGRSQRRLRHSSSRSRSTRPAATGRPSISAPAAVPSSDHWRFPPGSPTNRSVSSSRWSTAPATCRGRPTRAPDSRRLRHRRPRPPSRCRPRPPRRVGSRRHRRSRSPARPRRSTCRSTAARRCRTSRRSCRPGSPTARTSST